MRERLLKRSRELIARLRKLGELKENDQRTAMAGNMADAQLALDRGHLEEASALYTEVLADAQRRAAADPSNLHWQSDLLVSYGGLGEVGMLDNIKHALFGRAARWAPDSVVNERGA